MTAEDKAELIKLYDEMSIGGLRANAARAIQDLQNGNLTIENYLPVGTWNLLPEKWINHEPCLAMILEWITSSQIEQSNEIKRRLEEGDQMAAMADPMRDLLDAAVEEANNYGYSRRCVTELSALSAMPDKERGSVLSTGLTGIGIFKNSAVVARTSFSDIQFKDLRGMKDPVTGEWKPISVYLSVNQTDAQALNPISATFVDLMSAYLISIRRILLIVLTVKLGPFPTLFVLDEFPQMPKLKAVIDGPAVGRGQKSVIPPDRTRPGSDFGQIRKRRPGNGYFHHRLQSHPVAEQRTDGAALFQNGGQQNRPDFVLFQAGRLFQTGQPVLEKRQLSAAGRFGHHHFPAAEFADVKTGCSLPKLY